MYFSISNILEPSYLYKYTHSSIQFLISTEEKNKNINISIMVVNMKALLLSSLLLATITSLAFAYESEGRGQDRELKRELEQCQQHCQTEHRGQRQQQQCQRGCETRYEERQQQQQEEQRQQRERRGERDEEEFNPQEPQQQLQRCRQTCSQRYQGAGQEKQLCDRRCQQVYEQQRKQQGDDEEFNPQEPEKRLQRCQQTCSQSHQGVQEQQRCQRMCQERYEQEQRGGRRGGRDDEEEDLNPEEPRQRLQRCQQTCSQSQQGGQEQERCQRMCQERYEQEQRQRQRDGRRGGRDEDIDEVNPEEPRERLQRCRQTCSQSHQGGEEQQRCQRMCQKRYEQEQRESRRDEVNDHHREDPQRRLQRCREDCGAKSRDQRQVQQCQLRCQQQYEEERQRQQERDGVYDVEMDREREQRESRNNPYHFQSQRLQSRFRTDEGQVKVLEKFSQRSELLRGLENYRLAVLEAQPSTFVAPHHCDADSVLVVTKGKGTINVVRQNNKESHSIERADVIVVPAGSTVYMTNQDNKESLQIVKLITSINIPGQFEELFPGGSSENPQSYFSAFSNNILRPSLSATEEQIEKLTGEQRQGQRQGQREGFIKRASQEQLKALSQHATSPRRRGHESSGPVISLQNQSPRYSNTHGKFYEVTPEQNKQLKDMDVLVSWCELNQGTIMVPHYNSKTTVLVMVVEGTGRMEMACPHLSRQSQRRGEQEEESQSGKIERVTAQLSPGDVFIIPAGHPVAVVANSNQKLRTVGFGVNARNNERNFIAGKDNIIKQLEKEAQELAFNMQGSEVEQIFNQPKLSYFVPQQQQEEGRGQSHPLSSILNLAGFA
ncbi:vicilin Jug r 2.0101 [Cannabis sativa]|uniref:vicilin Jug r 2.0101 n=1 Tax=Cannabis sativa TaxID=3483 RepID=UPI0029C9D8AC|nr:vicilin Jug r 2.0101 [Cannabis sativa]